MTSFKNSRTHKERAQPAHRARLGLLEKHKDYVLRARDYHAKQARLSHLHSKVANRNRDEFYFAMKHERTVRGVHVHHRGNTAMPIDMVKLLKTQDEGYIRTMRAVGLKKIDRIKSQLTALVDLATIQDEDLRNGEDRLQESELETLRAAGVLAPKKTDGHEHVPHHIVFVEDDAEVQRCLEPQQPSSSAETLAVATEPSRQADLGWKPVGQKKSRRRRKHTQVSTDANDDLGEEITEHKKHRKQLLKELAARLSRDTQLLYALRELEMQRQLVGKGGRRKIRGVEEVGADDDRDDSEDDSRTDKRKPLQKTYKPRIYKWRIERKR